MSENGISSCIFIPFGLLIIMLSCGYLWVLCTTHLQKCQIPRLLNSCIVLWFSHITFFTIHFNHLYQSIWDIQMLGQRYLHRSEWWLVPKGTVSIYMYVCRMSLLLFGCVKSHSHKPNWSGQLGAQSPTGHNSSLTFYFKITQNLSTINTCCHQQNSSLFVL